ncbi:DMT family transporter [Aquabacterium sp. J223]|nr:DMT family transporter [Aquabacterium sp. J223]
MVLVAFLWSIAGIVTRQLESAGSFEVTFWRSAFTALSLGVALSVLRGPGRLWRSVRQGGWMLWASAVCWCVMFTAFMLALTLTTVANVLLTMALGPLVSALIARFALGHRLAARTWWAIALAAVGIVWMQREGLAAGTAGWGSAVAFVLPLAGALNWIVIRRAGAATAGGTAAPDLRPSVLLGALLSALLTLPAAWPLQASTHDLGWLALLGALQLALPCLLAVRVAAVLPSPEVALLALLEVVMGVLWVWLFAGERPSASVLGGGALVLGALALNEWLGLRGERAGRAAAQASGSAR